MATISISCPKCENQIKLPADLEGKKIRCKECAHVFVVKVPPEAKAALKAEKAKEKEAAKAAKEKEAAKGQAGGEEEEDANPYKVTDHSLLPRCAYCAKELESEDQVICLNCGYNHRTRERIQTEKTYEPTGGEWFLRLLPGILCVLVVLFCLFVILNSWIGREEKEAAYSEWAVNPFGLGICIWRTVIFLFIGFFAGRFAVKRLILNPRPVERRMVARQKAK
jgi:DNA-directed RNA polymerase subunit RPC12/RpoP